MLSEKMRQAIHGPCEPSADAIAARLMGVKLVCFNCTERERDPDTHRMSRWCSHWQHEVNWDIFEHCPGFKLRTGETLWREKERKN